MYNALLKLRSYFYLQHYYLHVFLTEGPTKSMYKRKRLFLSPLMAISLEESPIYT